MINSPFLVVQSSSKFGLVEVVGNEARDDVYEGVGICLKSGFPRLSIVESLAGLCRSCGQIGP